MVRDQHRNDEHFLSLIAQLNKSHENRNRKLDHGQIKPNRIVTVKQNMVGNLIQKIVAKYSGGFPIPSLVEDFDVILDLIEESWADGSRKLVGANSKVLDQYSIDPHTQLVRVLSIGFLCKASKDFFSRLGQIINNDRVVDLLFEVILDAKIDSWTRRSEPEGYSFKLYGNLKEAITQTDIKKSEELVRLFLENDWLKELKKAQLFTEPDKDWYHGRWSFESATIVALKGLDDSTFRENEYYPKDLVDYYRSNS